MEWPTLLSESGYINDRSLLVRFPMRGRSADKFERTASKLTGSASGGDGACRFEIGVHKPKLPMALVVSAVTVDVVCSEVDDVGKWV
jgi:hypothetical protein